MDEGITRPIYEIFEIIVPILLLILLGGAILFVTNPNFVRSYVLEKEISYISDLTSNGEVVEINLKNTPYDTLNVKTTENKVAVSVNGDNSRIKNINIATEYFSKEVTLDSTKANVLIISK